MSGVPILGALYLNQDRAGIIYYTQPGGPGTEVFPQQSIGEHQGLLTCVGGHWFNNYEVRFDEINGQQVALLLCPLCSVINRIFVPANLIYNDVSNYILLA